MSPVNLSPKYKDFVETLFKGIEKGDLEYIYKGEVTSEVVTNILDLAKINMNEEDLKPLMSRIYFILGEGLQNISIHQEKIDNLSVDSIIFISKKGQYYTITTGNLIKASKKEELEKRLNQINSMTVEELRDFARYIRKNYTFNEKGGANLGLVEMAKRSGSQLVYGFKDINEYYSYFYFTVELDIKRKIVSDKLQPPKNEYRNINFLKKFHNTLEENNIYLVFKGDFHQNNVLALFEILRKQMAENAITIKLKNVMIEIIQNIEKHGENINGSEDWKPGMLTIHELNDKFYITATNYIKKDNIKALSQKIDYYNSLSPSELSALYREKLFNETDISSNKTGLGLIDICRRSGEKIFYDFSDVNENYSIFYIQTAIK